MLGNADLMDSLLGCGRAGNTQEVLGRCWVPAALGAQTGLLQVCSEPAVGPEQRQCVPCKLYTKHHVLVSDIPAPSRARSNTVKFLLNRRAGSNQEVKNRFSRAQTSGLE